jgi:hypothetical protein
MQSAKGTPPSEIANVAALWLGRVSSYEPPLGKVRRQQFDLQRADFAALMAHERGFGANLLKSLARVQMWITT